MEDGSNSEQRYETTNLLESMQSFNFVFSLHLIRVILGITSELSQALQRKDQDIINATTFVKVCKKELQIMRESGWSSLHDEVSCFCEKYDIDIPNMDIDIPDMDDIFLTRGRP